jgi:hypothetical protein
MGIVAASRTSSGAALLCSSCSGSITPSSSIFLPLKPFAEKLLDACSVDSFSPSSWKPQEEGMMNIAARFSLSKKPRFLDQERNRQTTEGDAF